MNKLKLRSIFYSLILPIVIGITCSEINAQLPEGFVEETITDQLFRPVGITFDQNGQCYAWEKNGLVYVIDTSDQFIETPMLDIREEIADWGDHGMMGFALDPDFLVNGYFYLLYAVDRHHLLYYGTPAYEPDSTIKNSATIGRITRYQADANTNFSTVVPDSRKILLGESIDKGIPIVLISHGVGSLFFGTDGTLLASTGEVGSFLSDDYGSDPNSYYQQCLDDGIIQPYENVGSFRSQLVDNLNGKILRIDPETGDGIPSNPFFNADDPRAPRSRVYALGLRNPYRCVLRPGTGSHDPAAGNPGAIYIGDVGGDKWEELSVCDAPGMNFGWPLYEGILKKPGFWGETRDHPLAPNPLFGVDGCEKEFFTFQELLQQATEDQSNTFSNDCATDHPIDESLTFVHALPKFAYANKLGNKPARTHLPYFNADGEVDTMNVTDPASPIQANPFFGISSLAGTFYEGDNFPEEYRGKYFHSDYSWWIKTFDFDEENNLQGIQDFHNHSDYVVTLAVNPKNGCLYYINFVERVHRICYGGNNPPVAKAIQDVLYGQSPLTVQFNGEASFDPEGTELEYLWDFGDGTTSAEKNPAHTFITELESEKRFDVRLTVTDSLGATGKQDLIVSLNNSPPRVEILTPQNGDFYSVNGYSQIPLLADVLDPDQPFFQLDYTWTVVLKHNEHEHEEAPIKTVVAATTIEPLGCAPNENYWYEIRLEVEDSFGLVGRDTVELFPYCDDPFFQLEYWKGSAEAEKIVLNWSALREDEVDYYLLQKITADNGLQDLGQITAAGAGLAYHVEDSRPVIGNNNYRLKIFREDGTYDFSPEIRITFPKVPLLKVYPNPTEHSATFEVDEVKAEQMTLEIFAPSGALVIQRYESDKTFEVALAHLPAGIYTYRLLNGEEESTGKLIKLP